MPHILTLIFEGRNGFSGSRRAVGGPAEVFKINDAYRPSPFLFLFYHFSLLAQFFLSSADLPTSDKEKFGDSRKKNLRFYKE